MAFDFAGRSGADKIALIYTAYYGRLPDPLGFAFWNDFYAAELAANKGVEPTVLRITDYFLDQDETRANYVFFADTSSVSLDDISIFLDEVYFNLFGRSPDIAGKAFWSQQIFNRLSQDQGFSDLLVQIIEGAQGDDISALENKLDVGRFYVENIGEDFDIVQATRIAQDTTDAPLSAEQVIFQIQDFIDDGARFFDANRSDTHILVSELNGGQIALVDVSFGTYSIIADTGLASITDIALLPTGDLVIASFGTLYLYSFASKTIREMAEMPISVNALEANENGTLFAAGPGSRNLYQVDLDSDSSEVIARLPAGTAGDISALRDSLFLSLQNDQLVFVSLNDPSEPVLIRQEAEISDLWGLVQLGNTLLGAAGDRIYDISDASDYRGQVFIDDPAFSQISGSTYLYNSMVDFLSG